MGIDTAWFRDDASLEIAIANIANEMNGFYVAQPLLARVTLRNSSRIWQAHVMPTLSYLSQSELPITFGFGTEKIPSEMEIRWPRGTMQDVNLEAGNRALTIQEPK